MEHQKITHCTIYNGIALQDVNDRSIELVMASVKQNGITSKYVIDQSTSTELLTEPTKQKWFTINKIKMNKYLSYISKISLIHNDLKIFI